MLRAVQEYKTKLSQEQTDRRNSYYDFKERKPQEQAEKRNSHVEKKPGEDTGEGDALLANS